VGGRADRRAAAGDRTVVRVAIHQPEAFPWLGFFDKLARADVLVLLDSVQFRKNYFQNRNRIRTADGWVWITVPVLTAGRASQDIAAVEINATVDWRAKIRRAVTLHYGRARHFAALRGPLFEILERPWERLAELNLAVIAWLAEALGIRRRMVRASELGAAGARSELLVDLCGRLGATEYISGISGRTYLDESLFVKAGIAVRYQEFHHPVYPQCYEPFVPCMSALDLLFTHGPEAGPLLLAPDSPRLTEVFV
jgi:hypothetical protein